MKALRFVLCATVSAVVSSSVAGCSAQSEGDTSNLDDALAAQDYNLAVRNLASLPYLPWAYTTDGCYARALYYSMLLSTKGIPTNHLYVVARPGTTLGGQWSWHVAPVVTKAGDTNHLYVLDPVYDKTRALTNVEWVAKQFFPDPSAANYPRLHVDPGNSYLTQRIFTTPLLSPGSPDAEHYKEPVMADMPKFHLDDVNAACSTMHRYLDLEPGVSADARAQRHLSLGRETQRILGKLATIGKLDDEPSELSASCVRHTNPSREPDPSVDPSRVPVVTQ